MIQRCLVAVGLWLARLGGWTDQTLQYRREAWLWQRLTPPPAEVVALARRLTVEAESMAEGTSGEYKRHAVYSRLIKAHPEVSKRDLSLAIELALR